MRTKALILGAAALAAGVASSMAQSNVYSLNVVGYVNVSLPAGFNMVVNPLDDGAGNYLTNIIGNTDLNALPDGTTLYPWGGAGYGNIQTYYQGFGWYDAATSDYSTNQVPPGAGFFLNLPSAATYTFVGSVTQGTTTNKLGAGFTLTGSTFPTSLPLGVAGDGLAGQTMQLPVQDSDNVYIFNNPGGYEIYTYYAGYGWYDPANATLSTNGPAPAVGQGFFTLKAAANNWVQTFNVQ